MGKGSSAKYARLIKGIGTRESGKLYYKNGNRMKRNIETGHMLWSELLFKWKSL